MPDDGETSRNAFATFGEERVVAFTSEQSEEALPAGIGVLRRVEPAQPRPAGLDVRERQFSDRHAVQSTAKRYRRQRRRRAEAIGSSRHFASRSSSSSRFGGSFCARITTKPLERATTSALPKTSSTSRLRLSRRLITRYTLPRAFNTW